MRGIKRIMANRVSSEILNVSILVVALSLAVLISSIAVSILINELSEFIGITDFYEEQDGGSKTLVLPCSNFSLGDNEKTFSGDTFLFSTCPTSENQCSEFVCTEDRHCEQRTKSGSSCYQNSQCNVNNTRCDLSSCECVSDQPFCLVDSDCGVYNSNPCVEKKCISGQCITDLISNAECGSSSNCGSGFSCSSNCTCIRNPSSGEFANYDIIISPYVVPNTFPFITNSISAYGQYFDYGEYVMVNGYFVATSNPSFSVRSDKFMYYVFSVPILAGSENGSGIATLTPIGSDRNVTGILFSSGAVFANSASDAAASVFLNNYNYIGPPIEMQYECSFFFLYIKA